VVSLALLVLAVAHETNHSGARVTDGSPVKPRALLYVILLFPAPTSSILVVTFLATLLVLTRMAVLVTL
jgi:hypothetical protein